MVLVDTCGWIEWLTDGTLADAYAPHLKKVSQLLAPVSVQYELYKWVKREKSEEAALEVVAMTEQGKVLEFSTSLALLAADMSLQYKLSFADAIIYASARQEQAKLVTSDAHFEGLPGVVLLRK